MMIEPCKSTQKNWAKSCTSNQFGRNHAPKKLRARRPAAPQFTQKSANILYFNFIHSSIQSPSLILSMCETYQIEPEDTSEYSITFHSVERRPQTPHLGCVCMVLCVPSGLSLLKHRLSIALVSC